MEYDLIRNALHSLNEAFTYYNNDITDTCNVDKLKFCIIHTNHCAELLLKEVLVRIHPAFIYKDIDNYREKDKEPYTIGYSEVIDRVKNIANIDFQHYENYLRELGKERNNIQHYKCNIDAKYYKNIILSSFSAVEFIIHDILDIDIKQYNDVIDVDEFIALHDDSEANLKREEDIRNEFEKKLSERFQIDYGASKPINPRCPICGKRLLSIKDGLIICKFCATKFDNYKNLCEEDWGELLSKDIRNEIFYHKDKIIVYKCHECENNSVVKSSIYDGWICLCCGEKYDGDTSCYECGNEMPNDNKIFSWAICDYNSNDIRQLCQSCANKAKKDENYIGFTIE